jgi:hypothetical protein
MFDVVQKSSKFLLEIMTLVSSANIMGSVKVPQPVHYEALGTI